MTTPDLSKATPRPWTTEPLSPTGIRSVLSADNEIVCSGTNEDTALIVAAVNAYDKARELAERQLHLHHVSSGRIEGCCCSPCKLAREVLRIMGGDRD